MNKVKTNTEKSFIYAMIILLLFVITYIGVFLKVWNSIPQGEFIIGVPFLIAGYLGVVGSIYLIKGRKDKISVKKVISLTINIGVMVLFIGLIINNVIDIKNVFN
ncbi:hypothetical protein [Carboxylicivirga sp. N1Y90]|uniref:hypothetical protein n=1 Tax=Carboxylicivirga fragile TaxID=3417571 RepID=UPI003D3335B1|nr:hypothetical protein [Marinilabiliaceae bacterium N1Y90]